MPRIARVVLPGVPHHVTHRGNRRARVFLEQGDEKSYLALLRANAEKNGLSLWAYCLMPNHVHLVVVGAHDRALAQGIGLAHRKYARRIHERNQWTGHLWANRFHSTPLDEAHLWAAVRYVERNPVRAGLALRATEYPWSSAAAHAGRRFDALLDPERPFPGTIGDWEEWLQEEGDSGQVSALRRNTVTGRPTGSRAFVQGLERQLGRSLERRPPGRPRNEK